MGKKYIIDDNVYYFNRIEFNNLFNNRVKKEKKKIYQLELELGNYLNLSSETVHSWKFKKISPSDIETVKSICAFFDVDNNILFMKGENYMEKLNENKINSVQRIYATIMDYLDYFDKTNGFNDLWFDLDNQIKNKTDKLYDIALAKVSDVILAYKKELPILFKDEIYNILGDYIYDTLYDMFEGKLEYGYRFEAQVNGNLTTTDEIDNALRKLNIIIQNYC